MARVLTVTLNPALDLTVQLPSLRLGEVNRSESLQVHAAGKGLNVAQVLADLGHQLTVTGFSARTIPRRSSNCSPRVALPMSSSASPEKPAATSNWPRPADRSPISTGRD